MSGKKPPKPATRASDESTMVGSAPPGWAEQIAAQTDAELVEGLEDRTDPGQHSPSQTLIGPGADYVLGTPTVPAAARTDGRASEPPIRPAVEVEIRRVSSAASVTRKAPPAFEIWTKNRVYALDSALKCIEVIDLASGRTEKNHPFVSAHLVGGQVRVEDNTELTFPLPTPGAEAVFQHVDAAGRPRLSLTSRVTRVLLHIQVVRVEERQRDDTWDVIASTRHGR